MTKIASLLILVCILILFFGRCAKKEMQSSPLESLPGDLNTASTEELSTTKRIEDELKFRSIIESTSALSQIYANDSIWILTDSGIVRNPRILQRDISLEDYSTDTLTKMLSPKVLYNADDRKDWFEYASDSPFRTTSLQVACLIKRDNLKRRPDGKYEIKSRLFSESQYLCTAERFSNQVVPGFCSGFAVSSNVIVTAGHCAMEGNLNEFAVVFGFLKPDKTQTKTVFTASEIYTPTRIIERGQNDANGVDFAVLEIDHSVPQNRIARIRNTPINAGEAVFVIGHPCGLPLKIAEKAKVIDNSFINYFTASLDTYGGNSGSPVFDVNHNVVGILVRGERDFNYHPGNNCYFSNVCSDIGHPGCNGEGVSRVSQFIQHIPSLQNIQ